MDTARTALRMGAEEVHIFYRRTREQMPVSNFEYESALAEGIKINFLVNPTRIASSNWKVNGLQCIRMQLGEPGKDGRRRPVPVSGSEFFVSADTVFASVGQAPDLSFLPRDSALERSRWETLVVDDNKLSTNVPGVFAGGDFVSGPGMVVEAIAAGRRGALAIDKYFKGDASRVLMYDLRRHAAASDQAKQARDEKEEDLEEVWQPQFRPETPQLPLEQRIHSFQETELCFSEEEAQHEASRCLRCDLES